MKRFRLVIVSVISIICTVTFLVLMASKANDVNDIQYPSSEQIVGRFVKEGAAVKKTSAVPPFQLKGDYEALTDGVYTYFVDVEHHLISLINRDKNLTPTGPALSDTEIEKKAESLFRKAYGYELIGNIEVNNWGSMDDEGSRIRVEVVETIDELETGNKGTIFFFADGTLSRATFLPGRSSDSIARDKDRMITEDKAREIAVAAVNRKVDSSDVAIIESEDEPYSAKIKTFDNRTFWTVEFAAEFTDRSGEKKQAFFGVQIDVLTGQVLKVYSSLN